MVEYPDSPPISCMLAEMFQHIKNTKILTDTDIQYKQRKYIVSDMLMRAYYCTCLLYTSVPDTSGRLCTHYIAGGD